MHMAENLVYCPLFLQHLCVKKMSPDLSDPPQCIWPITWFIVHFFYTGLVCQKDVRVKPFQCICECQNNTIPKEEECHDKLCKEGQYCTEDHYCLDECLDLPFNNEETCFCKSSPCIDGGYCNLTEVE